MSKFLPLCIMLFAASMSVSAQTYTVIHNFGSVAGDPGGPRPPGTIAQSRGGAMLTTTRRAQGASGYATSGSLQVLHQFERRLAMERSHPGHGWKVLRHDQNERQHQTLGRYSRCLRTGSVTKLHDFTGGSDGELPYAAPIQSLKGDFYGTTSGKGFLGNSTVWDRLQDHEGRELHAASRFYRQRWREPSGPLVQGTDYYFYGTTVWVARVMTAPSSGSAHPVISRSS